MAWRGPKLRNGRSRRLVGSMHPGAKAWSGTRYARYAAVVLQAGPHFISSSSTGALSDLSTMMAANGLVVKDCTAPTVLLYRRVMTPFPSFSSRTGVTCVAVSVSGSMTAMTNSRSKSISVGLPSAPMVVAIPKTALNSTAVMIPGSAMSVTVFLTK